MNRTNMQQAGKRKYYSRYIAHYTKRNTALLALGALFIAGVTMGTLMIRSAGNETLDMLFQLVNGFVVKRQEQGLMENFLSSASSSLLFLAVLAVCGFCAISQPVVVLLPFFRGLGVGFSVASLYAGHGMAATGFVALLILPGTLLSTLAILVCCRESLRLSRSFLASMGAERQNREFYPLRIYLARYLACGGLCLVSALLESVLYFGFAGFFPLG